MRRSSSFYASHALPASELTKALESLPGWRVKANNENIIVRDYVFANFTEAIRYMDTVAPICEKMQHHPCWSNVYNRLHVELTTHDANNNVTQKDVDLAKAMNETYEEMRAHPSV
ncbi:pterin-4-alpha-carbinolamine dehydratase, putative [Leishmania tarentolae]|uniref:4a-hydroxytetrahydrobiopterin dehydratase n=1 Tax=Leishmania tarentolae TaxID=5689 RepID=A0A640KAF5_LEITA|nr:pterin-4-alpha-carbinolamine dehydratase, putative [Leishmania tarentolae]GET93975.1 pterin-4-alpha-carbinolamine dehydratase, putative [Leishmania tarentolae]GET93976.1 pterin-4-alpha-carbinolamine dehydratase, putative [Leishmania tarentolae]